jgi:putative glycerol-1-phosphate prenyltransferase
MTMNVYSRILEKKAEGIRQIAVLIDPDKSGGPALDRTCELAVSSQVDFIFVGGSLVTQGNLHQCLRRIKLACELPVVIFPGNAMQIDPLADAILFLSLISGRNPEFLIGNQVVSAPVIRENGLEPISTGYMLIESGTTTTAMYMSNSMPLPADKPEIAACTAMAGEMLGLKSIFMDAGSGARNPVSESIIRAVRNAVNLPIIVGGGINSPEMAMRACKAGADMIVVGNSVEKDPSILPLLAGAIKSVTV